MGPVFPAIPSSPDSLAPTLCLEPRREPPARRDFYHEDLSVLHLVNLIIKSLSVTSLIPSSPLNCCRVSAICLP